MLDPPARLFGIHPLLYGALLLMQSATPYLLRREREKELARITTSRTDLREQEIYAGRLRPGSLAQRAALRQAARALRQPLPVEGRRLDVPATVQASVRAAGRFEPVYRGRRAMRSVLVLIDRPRPADARAQLAWEKACALKDEGVPIEVWEFDRDPRWVRPFRRRARSAVAESGNDAAGAVSRPVPLATLAARCAGMGLLVFSDGQGCIDPRHGTVWPWVRNAFQPWPDRALLTPMPLDHWGEDESALADAKGPGFFVAPALTLSLPMVAQWWAGRQPQLPFVPGAPEGLPREWMGPALRWLGDVPLDADDQQTALREARHALGPRAFRWLAASAAYPALSIELTAFLAEVLDGADAAPGPDHRTDPDEAPLRDMQFLALAQLPWFRQGRMPDWWRLALLDELPPRSLAAVRAALESLLASDGRTAGEIALGAVATVKPVGESWWQRVKRRQRSAALSASESPGSALRDVIYLGVLDGSIDRRLRLRLRAREHTSGPLGRRSWNPLRWVAAGMVLSTAPAVFWGHWRRSRLAGRIRQAAAVN